MQSANNIKTSLFMPEWQRINMGELSEQELFRHFLFLGETGSGKTRSGIMPLCRLALRPQAQRCSALVVDPKGELGDYIEAISGDEGGSRFIRIRPGAAGPVLWQFEQQTLEGRDGDSIMDGIMMFADSYNAQKRTSVDRFWVDGASQLLARLVDIDLALYRHPNGKGVGNIRMFWRHLYGLFDLMNMHSKMPEEEQKSIGVLMKSSSMPRDERKDIGVLIKQLKERRLRAEVLEEMLETFSLCNEQPLGYCRENYLHHFSSLLGASTYYAASNDIKQYLSVFRIETGEHSFNRFWGLVVTFMESYMINEEKVFPPQALYFRQFVFMADSTYSSFQAVFSSLINDFMPPEFFTRISLNPFEMPRERLDVKQILTGGAIVIYEPGSTSAVATCIGKVIKAIFFKALLTPERLDNPTVLPFFYICDEFQRFITHDDESGEQSFLDRCRAYRVGCALATQSLASLRYVFSDTQGNEAIDIIINNTGTKMFFRTTDTSTADTLRQLIPEPVFMDRPHVVRVRPPTTLQPGECYCIAVNGRVGRGQVMLDSFGGVGG